MPLTVASMEAEILNRIGGKWAQANLSVVIDGTNADLKAPIRKALRYVGLLPADPSTVVDADLTAIPAKKAEVFMDAATLEALYAAQGRMPDGFDQQIEQERQSLHQIMEDLATMIRDYQSRVPKLNVPGTNIGVPCNGTVPYDPFPRGLAFNRFYP